MPDRRRNPLVTDEAAEIRRQREEALKERERRKQEEEQARQQQAEEQTEAEEEVPEYEKHGWTRDRSWDMERSKATYDLPPGLIDRVRDIADELASEHPDAKVRISDVARLLLQAGIDQYESGELDVRIRPTKFRIFPD